MPNEARVKRKKEERLEAAAAKTPKLDIYILGQRRAMPARGSVAKTTTEHPVA